MGISDEVRYILNKYATKYYIGKKQSDENIVDKACDNLNIDSMGWDCIGNGSGRNVFDMHILGYPQYALKLAIPHERYDGKKQNNHEIKLWNVTLNETQKEYVAPVIDYGPNKYWLIMPKGKSDFRMNHEWLNNAKYELKNVIWNEDIHRDNIIYINGELKLCDYGTPP